jgi:phage baseplate assembly protein W
MGQFKEPILDFIGKGLKYPLELDNGKAKLATGKELISMSVQTILSWVMGTRFMLGEFGSRVHLVLEEPNEQVLNDLSETFIKESLTTWEPRIDVLRVNITQDDNNKYIQVIYSIKDIPGEETFIYPFYTEINN